MDTTEKSQQVSGQQGSAQQGMRLQKAFVSATPFSPGRRPFFKYRDLGVADASAGALRAQVMSSSQGMSRPTGWHYHECDGQFIYMLEGWVDLEFEDGRTIRVEKGDSLFIPGYLRHNEIRTSDKMEILEVSSPGQMGTTPCDPPAGFSRP